MQKFGPHFLWLILVVQWWLGWERHRRLGNNTLGSFWSSVYRGERQVAHEVRKKHSKNVDSTIQWWRGNSEDCFTFIKSNPCTMITRQKEKSRSQPQLLHRSCWGTSSPWLHLNLAPEEPRGTPNCSSASSFTVPEKACEPRPQFLPSHIPREDLTHRAKSPQYHSFAYWNKVPQHNG